MRTELPKESRPGDAHTADYGEHKVDVYRLIHLAESIPEEMVDIKELGVDIDKNSWEDKNGKPLAPQQILQEVERMGNDFNWDSMIKKHPEWEDEISKIKKADYRMHPLIVIGENKIIDGMHRLVKAFIEKAQGINVKRFTSLPEETIISE